MIPPIRDPPPVAHDVLVVGEKHVMRQLRPIEEQPQLIVEAGDVVLRILDVPRHHLRAEQLCGALGRDGRRVAIPLERQLHRFGRRKG
ncbi:MAG: hypothetical protein WHU10_07330, partial [Fimbriimonadales bacterium]